MIAATITHGREVALVISGCTLLLIAAAACLFGGDPWA